MNYERIKAQIDEAARDGGEGKVFVLGPENIQSVLDQCRYSLAEKVEYREVPPGLPPPGLPGV